MTDFTLIAIVAVAAVGILVLGMSLTLIFKGHHIRSEIGTNPDMQRLGIKCTADEMRRVEMGRRGECDPGKGCAGCSLGCAPDSGGAHTPPEA